MSASLCVCVCIGATHTHLTERAAELWLAFAHEAAEHRVAAPAVLTRPTGTLVPLDLTVGAHEARRTLAQMSTPCHLLEERERERERKRKIHEERT